MRIDEEKFAEILDEVIDETLDLDKRDRIRFCNALVERLNEEDVFPLEDDEEAFADEIEEEDNV